MLRTMRVATILLSLGLASGTTEQTTTAPGTIEQTTTAPGTTELTTTAPGTTEQTTTAPGTTEQTTTAPATTELTTEIPAPAPAPVTYEWDNEHTDGSIEFELNGAEWTLELTFKHDSRLPMGTAETCTDSTPLPDGRPMGAGRAIYGPKLSDEIAEVTGFKDFTLDWSACGHPKVFKKPHYDVHMYYTEKAERDAWTCQFVPNAYICDPAAGGPFFDFLPTDQDGNLHNTPVGFEADLESAVPRMGIHLYDSVNAPPVGTWTDPVLFMGSYDSEVAFWEPMFPYELVSGEDASYAEDLSYQHQTMEHLPESYEISFTQSTGQIKVTIRGRRTTEQTTTAPGTTEQTTTAPGTTEIPAPAPGPTEDPVTTGLTTKKSGISTAAIAGIVIGVVLCIATVGGVYLMKCRD